MKINKELKKQLCLIGCSARLEMRGHKQVLILGRSSLWYFSPLMSTTWPAEMMLIRSYYPSAKLIRSSTTNAYILAQDIWADLRSNWSESH